MSNSIKKFIEIEGTVNSSIKNSWLATCRSLNIPYVTISVHGNWADVQWDAISYPSAQNAFFEENKEEIKSGLYKIYRRYATKDSVYSISNGNAEFNKFNLESARQAAIDIHDLVVELMAQAKSAANPLAPQS